MVILTEFIKISSKALDDVFEAFFLIALQVHHLFLAFAHQRRVCVLHVVLIIELQQNQIQQPRATSFFQNLKIPQQHAP